MKRAGKLRQTRDMVLRIPPASQRRKGGAPTGTLRICCEQMHVGYGGLLKKSTDLQLDDSNHDISTETSFQGLQEV